MKIAFPLLLVTMQLSLASELRLTSVTQPLYLHGSESDSRIALNRFRTLRSRQTRSGVLGYFCAVYSATVDRGVHTS